METANEGGLLTSLAGVSKASPRCTRKPCENKFSHDSSFAGVAQLVRAPACHAGG
jgi:hypothetical protein